MCPPVLIGVATAALAVGQQVTSYIGQNQRASANETLANYNYSNAVTTANQKAVQLDQQKSENAEDTAISTAQAAGRIAASASDQGLSGSSYISAINASMFGIGRQEGAEDINDQNARQQVSQDLLGADIKRQNQILSVPRASTASLLLGVGQGVLSGVNAANAAKNAGH